MEQEMNSGIPADTLGICIVVLCAGLAVLCAL